MKTKRGLNWKLIASVLVLLVAGPACRSVKEGETALQAKVVRIKGQARYASDDGKTWQALKVGVALNPESLVQTARDSYVDISLDANRVHFRNSSILYNGGSSSFAFRNVETDLVRIAGDSVLQIDKLTTRWPRGSKDRVKDARLELRSGRLLGDIGKQEVESVFEVRFTNGVAGVRGGVFALSADGVVYVGTGAVTVSSLNKGQSVEITGGSQFDARTGEKTELPDDLKLMLKPPCGGLPRTPLEPSQPWPKRAF